MSSKPAPYDQRLARWLVRPLARTPVTPNQLTSVTLLLALGGAAGLATGERGGQDLGAGLFVLARFMDHFDGELARLKGASSRFGYYYDYVAGALSYAALFAGIGIGLRDGALGAWALALGAAGSTAALLSMFANLGIDREQGGDESGEAVGYPGLAGFELEDGIYLIAPITWLGGLGPFFVAAGIGASVYCAWTFWSWWRLRRAAARAT